MKFWVGITGLKIPIGDPLRMKACFLRVSITDPPLLAVLENFILTHIFLTQCFPILLPYKNTELVHTAVIQLNFSRFAVVYEHPSGLSQPYLIEISLISKPSSLLITLPKYIKSLMNSSLAGYLG